MKIVIKIKELAKKNNISIRELGRISKLRHAALSELANNKRQSIDFGHIKRISKALNITDIREIIDICFAEENSSEFNEISPKVDNMKGFCKTTKSFSYLNEGR